MRRPGLTPLLFGGALLVLAIVIGTRLLSIDAVDELKTSNDGLAESGASLVAAGELERSVIDLETGLRGYLITEDPEFLAPRSEALQMIPDLERRLRAEEEIEETADRALLSELFAGIDRYSNGYQDRVLELAATDLEAARSPAVTAAGKRQVDALRTQFAEFIAAQATEQEERREAAADSGRAAETIGLFGLIAIPLLIIAALFATARYVVAPVRRLAAATRRLGEGDLETRVEEGGLGEVCELNHGFNAMAGSLRHSRDELESQNAELEAQQEELERALDELAEEKRRIETFHDFVGRMVAEPELDQLAMALLEEMTRFAGADAASLYVVEAGSDGEARLIKSIGFDRELLPARVRAGEGLAGRALAGTEEVVAEWRDPAAAATVAGFAGSAPVRHELHLPIGRGPAVGVVSLARLQDPGFATVIREDLVRMARPAAVALANALAREQTERTAKLNQAVLETANDVYMATDERGRVIEWTPHAERVFGYSAAEALGRPVEELTMAEEVRHLYAVARDQLIAAGERGEPLRFETVASDRAGRRFAVEVSAAAIRSRQGWTLSAFVRDIDADVRRRRERRAAEAVSRTLAEAEAGEDLLPLVVDALTEAMEWRAGALWEWDEVAGVLRCAYLEDRGDARLAKANAAARKAVLDPADSADEINLQALEQGRVLWEAIDPATSPRGAVLAAAGARAMVSLPIRSGETRLGALSFLLDQDQPPPGSELEAIGAIADLIAQVLGRRRAEQESERLKNEFFALVSHELRTPLTSITGYLDIVREGEAGALNEEQARFLGVIDRNARRLMRLVGDLLFVAQVEAGTLTLERGRADLGRVAAESVEAARPRAESQGILLVHNTEPVELEGADHDRLGQLVDNLVSNALKFTPEGGRIEVRVARTERGARLQVEDSGTGIDPDDLERLFERFYRAPAATEASVPGIGLGLSICRAIAEGHGGSISVASELGAGTTFTVDLPIEKAAPVAAARS